MKILKIRIKNINCLRSEWEIDFETPPLSHAGLFAITGPTGSGKSTILDAITLALFNKIPRFESDIISKNFIEKSGSIITRNETDSFVEVEYSCSEGTFRSKWFIALNKRGGLRETGMELIDVATNKPILSEKKEVPKKNAELIGLTYDQFIKSILLSQGEFARFLKSRKDERGKLLEDITGMTIYRELGKRAFEKFREKSATIRSRIDIIESEEDQLLSKEKENELDELIQDVNKEIQNKESNRAAIEKAIDIKNRIELVENEIEKYNQEEKRINETLDIFNEKNAQRVFKHERLLPYINEIKIFSTNYESSEKLNEDIRREEVELAKRRREENESVSSIGKFIGSEVKSHDAIRALTDFGIRVSHHITNKLNAEKAFNQQKTKILNHLKKPTLIKYTKYETSGNIDELKLKVYADIATIASKTEEILRQTKAKPDNINELKESANVRLRTMEDLKLIIENFQENQNKLKGKEQQIKDTEESIHNKNPELLKITNIKTSVNLQMAEVRDKREKKLREKNLEEERMLLKEEEPCPLCGSLHHPYVHKYFNNVSELTKELQRLEEEEKKYEEKKQELERQINGHLVTLDILRNDKRTIEKEMSEQKNKIEVRKRKLGIETVGKLDKINAEMKELEMSVKAFNEFEKVITSKRDLEDFKETIDELKSLSGEFEKLKSEVEKRYSGSDIRGDCDLLSGQLRSLKEAIQRSDTKIGSDKNQLEEMNRQQVKIGSSLNSILRSFGYPDILSSVADILHDAEFNNLKKQLSDLEGNIQRIKALIQGANDRKQQLLSNNENTKSGEELLEELNITRQQVEQDKLNLTDYHAQKKGNELRKNRITKLRREVDETRQANLKWELLCKYIGDATGKSFSTFAQGLTLKKLVLLTNERLRKLNDRYFLAMPMEEEDDDLVIIDTYLGEERRSVKTLSGGETFIVSLALALALSDLASKNVKIESLYIDEGFGSLDPEALDVAISTLEQLQAESNKTIGIISHVESLKDTIVTQIQLEKDSSGFSKIVIK